MARVASKIPSVVPRGDIPLARMGDDGRLEVRPFTAHRILSGVFPAESSVSLAWTQAKVGTDIALRCHSTPGLLIVLEGRAVLIGGVTRNVEAGDVVTLPALERYGFTAVGPSGLHALHVSFDGDPMSYADDAQTLAQLLRRHDARLQIALNNDFFSLLRRSDLDPGRRGEALRAASRALSGAFRALSSRRSKVGGGAQELSSQLDDEELAVANLVFETSEHYLARLSTPAQEDALNETAVAGLAGFEPSTYVRLQRVLDSSWDLVDAVMRPLARQVAAGRSS